MFTAFFFASIVAIPDPALAPVATIGIDPPVATIETAESDALPSAGFGISVALLTSLETDRKRRVAIANPHRPTGHPDSKGVVYVFTEGWGLPQPVLRASDPSTRFGTCMAADDRTLAVGVSAREGSDGVASLQLFRMSDFERERRVEFGKGEFVDTVHLLPDVDDDGRSDLLVEVLSAERSKSAGHTRDARVLVVSAASGKILRELRGSPGRDVLRGAAFVPTAPGAGGQWVAGVNVTTRGDDGLHRLTETWLLPRKGELFSRPVSTPEEIGGYEGFATLSWPGVNEPRLSMLLRLRSGSGHVLRWIDAFPTDATRTVLQEAKLDTQRDDLRVVRLTVDLNRDGRPDLLLAGQVVVGVDDWYTMEACDGTTGARLWSWRDNLLELADGPVVPAGDVDGDGVTDLLVGCPGCRGGMPGLALLVSGATGKILASFREP